MHQVLITVTLSGGVSTQVVERPTLAEALALGRGLGSTQSTTVYAQVLPGGIDDTPPVFAHDDMLLNSLVHELPALLPAQVGPMKDVAKAYAMQMLRAYAAR
jgi:hypothetical protein